MSLTDNFQKSLIQYFLNRIIMFHYNGSFSCSSPSKQNDRKNFFNDPSQLYFHQKHNYQQKINKLYLMDAHYTNALPLNTIRLPKIVASRHFRIRSASKDKIKQEIETAKSQRKSPKEIFFSNNKYGHRRSSSMNSTKSKKSKTKKSQANGSSEDQNNFHTETMQHLKTDIKCHRQTLQLDKEDHLRKLESAAKLFDPKTIMKMGKHHREFSHEDSSLKNGRSRQAKGSLRMKQFIYEQNRPKTKKKRSGQKFCEDADEFWRKVNESLILAPKNNQEEVSKDLKEIYETFVTE